MATEVIILCSYGLCMNTARQRGGVIGGPQFDMCDGCVAKLKKTAADAGVALKLEPIARTEAT